MRRRSPYAVVVTVALALVLGAACSGSSDSPEWVQELETDRPRIVLGTGTSTVPESQDAPVPDTTGDGAAVPPGDGDREIFAIDPTGDDFDDIWRQIQAFELWMLAHPDPTLATEIYVEGSDLHAEAVELLSSAHDQGTQIRLEGSRVLSVDVIDRPDLRTASLRYVDTRQARLELDAATGQELAREDYPPQSWVWEATLEADDQGRWRVADIEFIEFGPAAAD